MNKVSGFLIDQSKIGDLENYKACLTIFLLHQRTQSKRDRKRKIKFNGDSRDSKKSRLKKLDYSSKTTSRNSMTLSKKALSKIVFLC